MTRIVNCRHLVLVLLITVLGAGCGSDRSHQTPPPASTETKRVATAATIG